MNCTFERQQDGRWKCSTCGVTTKRPRETPPLSNCLADGAERPACKSSVPSNGPGTELTGIIEAVGKVDDGSCGCKTLAAQMNAWGPDGCREHRSEIIAKLQENAAKLGWWETVTIGKALMAEPWFNPFDPAGSMVGEAIRRAEAKIAPPREPSVWDQYVLR